MFLGISIIIWVLAVLLILICLAYIFYKQVIKLSVVAINLGFPIIAVIAFSALFFPGIYHSVAEFTLSSTPFAQQLKSIDETVTSASNVPNDIINGIQNLFNQNQQNPAQPVKTNLYGQFIDFAAEVIRWTIFIVSFILMIVLIYFKYSYSSVFEVQELKRRLEKMESVARPVL